MITGLEPGLGHLPHLPKKANPSVTAGDSPGLQQPRSLFSSPKKGSNSDVSGNRGQHAIDESARLLGRVPANEINCLAQHDTRRRLSR